MGQFGSIVPGLAIPEHDHVTLDPAMLQSGSKGQSLLG